MIPFWQDDHLTLYGGDCREILRELPAESVHCVVTSPPYWGLRDYGTASWDGGDAECDHRVGRTMGNANKGAVREVLDGDRSVCKCGARRIDSQLGLEATPEEFVANMVDVFREVRRVLRKDGTLWLNLGDSYVAWQGGRQSGVGEMPARTLRSEGNPRPRDDVDTGSWADRDVTVKTTPGRDSTYLKPKDLVGIPWRVAFALQADGWYLRSDIIWAKPNPMPESVTDRPTKAHEYLFLLTRSPRYYYDAEAVREGATRADTSPQSAGREKRGLSAGAYELPSRIREDFDGRRNLRSVWNIATEPYPGAHFATFPRKLVEPCVKAGTSERGVCPECGAPWVREFDKQYRSPTITTGTEEGRFSEGRNRFSEGRNRNVVRMGDGVDVTTTGWRPSCTCLRRWEAESDVEAQGGPAMDGRPRPSEPVPAVVLDPFAGSGTTLFVAQALGRRGVGIDLSPDYLKQALERNRQTPLGLVG